MPRQIVRSAAIPPPPPVTYSLPPASAPVLHQPSASELAVRALMRRAELARNNLEEFSRLVMRHELTRKPLEPAPHQKLAYDFMQHHDRSVLRWPVGTSKTTSSVTLALWLLGKNETERGGFVGRAQKQAAKPLGQVGAYITDHELSQRLALVFPRLQRSTRPGDAWNQSAITVERPAGIRDASIVAAGLDSKSGGSRWSWLVADDTVDDENTHTPEQRLDTNSKFDARLVSRLDPMGSRAMVTNTPWHREDLTYHLELEAGWPTLSMDVYGYVWFSNVDAVWLERAMRLYLRPSDVRPDRYRLLELDPDPEDQQPLWAARYSAQRIEEIRHGKPGAPGGMLPQEFARLMLCEPFAHGAARCQRSWVEACKARGVGQQLASRYDGLRPTFCGVDLGIGKRERRSAAGKASDKSVFFVIELMDDKSRRLLQVESGRWSGADLVDKIVDYYRRYKCRFGVESVAGQDFLRQWAVESRRDIVIKAHDTQAKNKHHLTFGVESVFAEMQQEAWIIPCETGTGRVHPEVQLWIDQMLYYQPPPAHTGDSLIASWIARELARGAIGGDPPMGHRTKLEMAQAAGGF